MFGNLRLYERHQTPTSYQVLSMQIQFVTHVFPLQLEKRNPNLNRFLFYELPFKFSLISYALTQQIFALLYQFCCCWMPYIHTYGVSFTLSWAIWSEFYIFKSFVLSDFSFVFVLHFTGKPNLTNLSKSRKNAQIVYEISHNSNVLSWKHNTLEKLQLWLSLANEHF